MRVGCGVRRPGLGVAGLNRRDTGQSRLVGGQYSVGHALADIGRRNGPDWQMKWLDKEEGVRICSPFGFQLKLRNFTLNSHILSRKASPKEWAIY